MVAVSNRTSPPPSQPPPTASVADVATALVDALVDAEVDLLTGVPGGGSNLAVIDAARARGMRFVLTHTETAACMVAATHGLLTGRPGVAVVTRGPGVAAATNGLAQATLDRLPLVLVADRVTHDVADRVAHQRLDQLALAAPVCKAVGTLTATSPGRVARAALAAALEAPAGAVHLDVDLADPGLPELAFTPHRRDGTESHDTATTAPREDLPAARALVAGARRPVMLVGLGAWPAMDAVRDFATNAAVPTLTTYQARGLVPDDADIAAGIFTNGRFERELLRRADLVLAVGLDHVEPIPAPWPGTAPVVAVTATPIRDRYHDSAAVLLGPLADSLARLAPVMDASGWPHDTARAVRQAMRDDLRASLDGPPAAAGDRTGVPPVTAMELLQARRPPRSTVTVDAGAHMLAAIPLLEVDRRHELLVSNGLATMGFAVPAAIGAALARPDEPVVAITGDGGLGMVLAELETIVRHDLDVTVVVCNDARLSLIQVKQDPHDPTPQAVDYLRTDFAAVARGMGMAGMTATTTDELDAALAGPWRGPRLVDVAIDPTTYPAILAASRG